MGRNTIIEDKAIKFVLDYEKDNSPEVCKHRGVGYDVNCSDKIIEVKGSTEKQIPFVTLNSSNIKALDNTKPFFIYVVYNLNESPKLLIIDKDYIDTEGKERKSIEVPLRKNNYEKSISLED
mgnify:CR=1 FL=1|jgi:hypothetical protein